MKMSLLFAGNSLKPRSSHYYVGFMLIATILILLLTACSGQASAEPAPPTIHFGEDICEFCGMIISEPRFAAGYITRDGREHIFDDIGDMFQAHLRQPAEATAFFVHNYDDPHWIRAETAFYVLAEELPTPMFSGLAASSSADQAAALAAQFNGQVLTFDQVLAHYRQTPPMMNSPHGRVHQHD
jgi:copper chaperone NosL